MIAAGCRVGIGLAVAASSACVTTPAYHAPPPEVPAQWSEASTSDLPALTPESAWWKTFGDSELDSLIERAIHANLDVRLADARIREARALYRVTTASRWPSIDASASAVRERESANAPALVLPGPEGVLESEGGQTDNLFQGGFDASWELDLFGARRRRLEAARADLESSADDRSAAVLTLAAEVARDYIELRRLQKELAVAQASLVLQHETLALARARYTGGMASELDVVRAEAQAQDTGAQIPALSAPVSQAMHRLAVLLGEPPGALNRELAAAEPVPRAPAAPSLGLPSDLLRQRPDIRSAERRVAAAAGRAGAARADLYPKFSLLGTAGLAGTVTGDFFDGASTLWAVGASITWPIFRGGQVIATIEVRDAQAQEALIAYRKTILNGLEDVENAVVAYQREQDRRASLAGAVRSKERAAELARALYQGGHTDFSDVLDAQRGLMQAQSDLARGDAALSIDVVALCKALGGGWAAVGLPADVTRVSEAANPSTRAGGIR